jgi:conjugal transfer pilus assembly protein TraV
MRTWSLMVAPLLLAGCVNMSGLSGESSFACKAPDGVTCASLSGVYANVVAGNTPRKAKSGEAAETSGATAQGKGTGIMGYAPSSGEPIRSPQQVLRVWIAPWEDTDGDLHDQSYTYVVVRESEWLIEYNRHRIAERFRPTVAQPAQGGAGASKAPAKSAPQTSGASNGAPAGQIVPPSRIPLSGEDK